MTDSEMKQGTKTFALRLLQPRSAWPRSVEADLLRRQSARSGTSVAAGYRAPYRAKSTADFTDKPQIVEGEADESALWLELIAESETLSAARVGELLAEANEITAMVVASQRTVRDRKQIKNSDSKIKNTK